jgi:hypothetical protein
MSEHNQGLTVAQLLREERVRDREGRVWTARSLTNGSDGRWYARDGIVELLSAGQLHAHLRPLTPVTPDVPGVWRTLKIPRWRFRVMNGVVESTNGISEWKEHVAAPYIEEVRLMAALAEGREPDPGIAKRLEEYE